MTSRNTIKSRFRRVRDAPEEIAQHAFNHGSREISPSGVLAYLLDSFCLPFQVFLRGKMGRGYFTYPKFILSSLFIYLCLCMMLFRFETSAYIGPFTPGGFRPIPTVSLPETFSDFIWHLRSSFLIWMDSFTPSWSHILTPLDSSIGNVYKIIAAYYLVANARFWSSKIYSMLTDRENPDSSGEPRLFGIIPIWNWLGLYHLAYVLNFKTDIVKQYFEPAALYLMAQFLLSKSRNPSEDMIFLGILCFFGAVALALQAFVRSLPARRADTAMLSASFRNEAREAHMEHFELFTRDARPSRGSRGLVTRQRKK